MRCSRLLLCVALLGPGCAIHINDHGGDALDEAIGRVSSEVNLHYVYLTEAQNLTEVRAEVDRHAPAIRARLRDVWHQLDDSRCFDGTASMYDLMEAAGERVDAYVAELTALSSLASVRDACARYGDDMDHLLGRMMTRWNSRWCP